MQNYAPWMMGNTMMAGYGYYGFFGWIFTATLWVLMVVAIIALVKWINRGKKNS